MALIEEIPFPLLPHQTAFITSTDSVVLLDGGFGAAKTTALCGWAYQECDDYPGNLILMGRHEYTDLADSTIRTFFDLIPEGKTSENWNEQSKTYRHPNGAEILFRHLDDEAGVKNLNLGGVGIDQAEEIEPVRFDLLLGRLRRQNSSRQMRLTSNPNGHDWLWQLFYPESPEHRDGYRVIRCKTTDNPHLPPDYLARMLKDYSPEFVEQYVYGSREVMLGYRFFSAESLRTHRIETPIALGYFVDNLPKPEFREQAGGSIRLYERYDERDPYVIGLDIATGEGSSRAAGVCLNARMNRTAAVLDADLRPDELAVQGWLMSRYFGNALLAPERNGIGFSVVSTLQQLTGNIFSDQISEFGLGAPTKHLGWWTDAKSRMELFAQMQREIAHSSTSLKDQELIEQCKAITMTKGKPKAEPGFRDDLVMARGIAGMVRKLRMGSLSTFRGGASMAPEPSTNPEHGSVYGFGRRGDLKVAGR